MNKLLKRLQLETLQYGVRPTKHFYSIRSNNSSRILANSLPKSGTNLLSRCLYLLPDFSRTLSKTLLSHDCSQVLSCLEKIRERKYSIAHLTYAPEFAEKIDCEGIRHVLMVRDPRDVAVSSASYISKLDPGHRLHAYFSSLGGHKQQIEAVLSGIDGDELDDHEPSLPLKEHYQNYLGWLGSANCRLVRFEDLVGASGGGSAELQRLTLEEMYKHLEIEVSSKTIDYVANNLFSTASRTFNKGMIGTWVKEFEECSIDPRAYGLGELVDDLGYA